jgi:hypothetical protein
MTHIATEVRKQPPPISAHLFPFHVSANSVLTKIGIPFKLIQAKTGGLKKRR